VGVETTRATEVAKKIVESSERVGNVHKKSTGTKKKLVSPVKKQSDISKSQKEKLTHKVRSNLEPGGGELLVLKILEYMFRKGDPLSQFQ
jgi:hypothetical protein